MPSLRTAAILVGTAIVYFAAAKLGLSLAFAARQVTSVWPPTGIALAALLIFGWRVSPAIFVAALLANLMVDEPPAVAAGIAAGNTLEALGGAWLLRRAGFRRSLQRLRDVLALAVLAALLSPMLAATVGVTSLCLGGVHPWSSFSELWATWWVGDALGNLVVAPVLFVWTRRPLARISLARIGEAAMLLGAFALASVLIFWTELQEPAQRQPLPYAIFPFAIWAAFRFHQRGVTAFTAMISAVAIWSTVHGRGPFATASEHQSLLLLQPYLAVIAMAGMLMAAAISERDRLERRARSDYARQRRSDEQLRLALAAGSMGVWDWSIATGDVYWSADLEALHGLKPGTFPRSFAGFLALVHPEDRERVATTITRAIDVGESYDVEFRNVWPDGSVRWMVGRGTAFRDDSGRATRVLGIGIDVTERRRLTEELARRMLELSEEHRRKDDFLAMLAHELRNPLAPLTTALHILHLDAGGDAQGREAHIDMAERQVRQLVRLVDDLLDVSRITRGKVTLRLSTVRLADVVARAVETVRARIETLGHKLEVALPAEPVELHADPDRLSQVLGNLLSNAAEYTPPGGSIRLSAEVEGGELVLRVRDSGIGLSAELLPQVFELFVQGEASLDRPRGGLGIGLTIVRKLVELHGGRVDAHSEGPGKGSEFIVRLPLVRAEVAGDAKTGAAAVAPRALRVLIVEDNRDFAQSLSALLGLWGHHVRVAFDGVTAVEIADSFAPEVVVSDLGLPKADGYALARTLRAHPKLRTAVLVALSGYGTEEDRRRALEAGFDHHLVKPPDPEALGRLLARAASASADACTRRT